MSGLVIEPPRRRPDPAVTPNLHRAAERWESNRAEAHERVDWEAWRERAREIRADAVRHLPELIELLEARMVAAGGSVHHARDGEEACRHIVRICREAGATNAVKGKSMTSEEIDLGAALAAAGIEAVETDLGEYIVQALGDRPSHLLAPAVHLNAVQVAELFARESGRRFDPEDTAALVLYARGVLRRRFLAAEVGITGVNLAVAETGTLAILESEGNIRLATALPRIHIALMGIEKVIRDWAGASHLVQMLPLAAHGTLAAASTSFITGPAREGDDGPQEVHLVLLDGGRSAVRGTPFEAALHCIRCGACLYACPVYRQVGGHGYGSTYSGPIGSVITPLLDRTGASAELAWHSSLCGACVEACPVKIPLDDQLVMLRARAHERDPARAEAALFAAWARLWSRPATYRATAATAGRALRPLWSALGHEGWQRRLPFPFSGWTDGRDARAPDPEPFHVRWRRRRGGS
ncbi:MAG: L-lactate dehydrogenase complex protein LldF [Solirubrobacteraceae bacterium]|nr:L-lactate dehydrogenase complex protein LldF [Solirubrobacteraceae bacterium]